MRTRNCTPFVERQSKSWIVRRVRLARAAACLVGCVAAAAVPGCRSYEPAPLEPARILADLDALDFGTASAVAAGRPRAEGFEPGDGINVREAAAFAVEWNPRIREARAEIGVASAQLVEAGLLPNPVVGWEATEWLVDGTRDSALSGLGLSWEVPRPGEIGARKQGARARVEEVRQEIMAAEWQLARRVALAWLDVAAARERLRLNEQLLGIARRTHDYFVRAREARAATALQENLAGIDVANLEGERERLTVAETEAFQALNESLGLRPGYRFELQAPEGTFAYEPGAPDPDAIVRRAVVQRPDLQALMALYQQAEAALKLEVRRQWPRIEIGTGIAIEIPVFSRFNGPAIRTRTEERERMRRRCVAAVHELRGEVHAALAALERTGREIRYLRQELEPRLQESLRLSEAARGVAEITPFELLTAQRQVLDARTRLVDLYIEHRKARELVATLDGTWSPPQPGPGEE